MQPHFRTYPIQGFGQEVRAAHPQLERPKGM